MKLVDSQLKTKASKQLQEEVELELAAKDKAIAEVLDGIAAQCDGGAVCRDCEEDSVKARPQVQIWLL